MRALVEELRLLLLLALAPRAALARIETAAPVGAVLFTLAGLQGSLFLAQSLLLQPALLADPLLAELPGGAPAAVDRFWVMRAIALLMWPVSCALRAAALAFLLQCIAILFGTPAGWRRLLSLALHLDVVFWLENLCVTLVIACIRPATLEALRTVRLHAGLDLFWQPESRRLASLLEAANGFTLWWACLLGFGVARALRLRVGPAGAVAAVFWGALVAVRFGLGWRWNSPWFASSEGRGSMSRSDRPRRWAAVLVLAVLALVAAPRAGHESLGGRGGAAITVASVAGAPGVSGGWRPKHPWLCAATAITIGATGGVVPPLGTAIAVALIPVLISACL